MMKQQLTFSQKGKLIVALLFLLFSLVIAFLNSTNSFSYLLVGIGVFCGAKALESLKYKF